LPGALTAITDAWKQAAYFYCSPSKYETMKTIIQSAAMILLLAGCNSSKITSAWRAGDDGPYLYKKIMVLALINDRDRTIQEKMETHLANDLKDLGYTAISSLKEYGPKAFDNMDETTALNKIRSSGVDAVLTIVMLDKEKERKYVASDMQYSPYGWYYNRFWGYRTALSRRIDEPGYFVTATKYFWETNLYEMNEQQRLVYSAQSRSFDPVNSEKLGHEYGQLIVKNMVAKRVLKQPLQTED
jgi:hypothetical protein